MSVGGITETDFNLWKHHPVTQLMMKYVADFRDQLIKEHLEDWNAGRIDQIRDLEIRGRMLTCSDIVEISFASIANFYPEQEGTDANENDQDR